MVSVRGADGSNGSDMVPAGIMFKQGNFMKGVSCL